MQANELRPSRRQVTGGGLASLAAMVAPSRAIGQSSPEMADGWRVLRARAGGYDGMAPGPLLRVRRGEELRVRLVNEAADPTAIHWHGLRLPNAMDGVPFLTQQPIAKAGSFDYRFTPPDAGTFWYRAPFVDQIDRGLYGPLIVDEADKVAVDRDLVLVIGRIGASILSSDGAALTDITVKTNERIRLRLINALSTETVPLRIEGHRANVMAIDGQPAEPFIANEGRVVIGAGNRIDLFIDTVLTSGTTMPLVVVSGSDAVLARIIYQAGPPARPTPPPDIVALPANPLPQRMDFARAFRRDLDIGNAAGWIPAERPSISPLPLFSVARGRTVMLALSNKSTVTRSVHLHGHSFRLLDRLDDGWKPFWLDTLAIPPGEIARIAFVADNRGTWAIENRAVVPGDSGRLALFDAN